MELLQRAFDAGDERVGFLFAISEKQAVELREHPDLADLPSELHPQFSLA